MSTIVTKSSKTFKEFPKGREITLPTPKVLTCETLADLVKIQGEDQCINQIKAQLTVAYRAKIRAMLDAEDDNKDPRNTEEAIKAINLDDWKPEPRVRKTAEEKAMEVLGLLPPEVRAAVLAEYKKDGNKKDDNKK